MKVFSLRPISAAVQWLLTPEVILLAILVAVWMIHPEEAAFLQDLIG